MDVDVSLLLVVVLVLDDVDGGSRSFPAAVDRFDRVELLKRREHIHSNIHSYRPQCCCCCCILVVEDDDEVDLFETGLELVC